MTPKTHKTAAGANPHEAATIEEIAARILNLETLEQRHLDRLDVHDLDVKTLEKALRAAYAAGLASQATNMPDTATVAHPSLATAVSRIAKDFLYIESFAEKDSRSGRQNYRAVYVESVGFAIKAAYQEGFKASLRSQGTTRPLDTPDPAPLAKIAMEELGIETFKDELWRQDRYDYRAVHASEVERALRRAYQVGFDAAAAASKA